jgi:SAM-dependent methyltransferase
MSSVSSPATTTWIAKPCDICGSPSERHGLLGHRRHSIATRTKMYEMIFDDVVCEDCGFIFSGKVPSESFLFDYYRNAHTSKSDYGESVSVENIVSRLRVLEKYVSKGSSVLEIGAATGDFSDALNQKGYRATGIDPLETDRSSHVQAGFVQSVVNNQSRTATYDAVVSYYVLEHVTRASSWLDHIRQSLKKDGILILEVPNVETYPAISLNHEHLLHFTPWHLKTLLEKNGFEVLDVQAQGLSPYYGMSIVSRWSNSPRKKPDSTASSNQAANARAIYQRSTDLTRAEEDRCQAIARSIEERARLSGQKTKVYFWAANEYAARIVPYLQMFASADIQIIDGSRSKIGTSLAGFRQPIQPPEFAQEEPFYRIFGLAGLQKGSAK